MSTCIVKNLTILILSFAAILLVSITLVHAEPVTVNPKFVIDRIFTSHFKPSTMAFLSADDILVLDRDEGKVFRIIDGVQSKPLLDVKVATVGYRGLLGVAASANEKNIPKVFLYYTEAHKRDSEDESLSNSIVPLGNRVYSTILSITD